mmetsp:Transcript_108506/g.203713  ORF Transcript_108506/g.203713 Transcript_108506/m.203713 type:complete len:352 (+) Transcript_108506:39-1094(+)
MVATVARFRRRISRRRRILFAARFSRRLRTASADHGLLPGNYLPEACKGCTVVHKAHPRILVTRAARAGKASFHWDPERKTFTVLNGSRHTRFAYLTFLGVDVLDYECQPFETGVTRAEDGEESSVTTFVVVAEPRTAVTLGTVEIDAPFADFFALPFSKLLAPPVPKQLTGAVACIGFPLPTSHGPYLCTQGNGGHLTHFFPESYHAVDLRCGCGTPVLCIDEGVVESLEEKHHCGGIHCGNLMSWNAVTVRLMCGLIVEYLHTAPNSARVQVGDRVQRGQVLCETSDIGFAPEPHLHVELHHADDPEGPSVPFTFRSDDLSTFLPVAGRWYSSAGEETSSTHNAILQAT